MKKEKVSKFRPLFRGMCKNCPYLPLENINKKEGIVYCRFGGIRELDQSCNIRKG
jgi:hypothetical protein